MGCIRYMTADPATGEIGANGKNVRMADFLGNDWQAASENARLTALPSMVAALQALHQVAVPRNSLPQDDPDRNAPPNDPEETLPIFRDGPDIVFRLVKVQMSWDDPVNDTMPTLITIPLGGGGF